MFLAARPPSERSPARITLLGAPYDATASFRRGSRFGPVAIRRASDSIETYSPTLDRDLVDASFVDGGDLLLDGLEPAEMVKTIRRQVPRGVPFFLGGEHTITLGAVQGITPRVPDLTVLQWDAHTDLRDEYDGERIAHATVMRRLLDGGLPLVQLGIRAGTREEFALAQGRCLYSSRSVKLPPALVDTLRTRPLYLSVDVDVLDPAVAPGTGNPEPDGAAYAEVLDGLRSLADCRIAGMDLVEVAPALDPSGRTAVIAASLVREMLLLYGG
ncbi:MAG TPA: agmatinase [bacterium]|nr:agmatinase [bacterium]